jgi:hypothetical protein
MVPRRIDNFTRAHRAHVEFSGQCNKSYPGPMKETYLRNSEEVIFTIVTPKWLVDRYAQAYAIKKAKGIEDKPS